MLLKRYETQHFSFDHVEGFSEAQLEHHYQLFLHYIATANHLQKRLDYLTKTKQFHSDEYARAKKRLNFEYNRIRLHEYFFQNFSGAQKPLLPGSPLFKALEASFGSYQAWKQDFVETALIRNAGWAILYQDIWTGQLINFWIRGNEWGSPLGFQPLLVLDRCEHAYRIDFKPNTLKEYIEAFFYNINWSIVESRFHTSLIHLQLAQ